MPRKADRARRRVCFVTGTRAEFGLMESVLRAIRSHPKLQLQIVATGMHLSDSHGRTLDAIRDSGWNVDQIVAWASRPRGPKQINAGETPTPQQQQAARSAGNAISDLAAAFEQLKTDIVLVTGDRVEAFAGATAAHLSGRVVAHVHGGDRALGQVDDSLRHAITKLAHVHFPATRQSAARIRKLGEDGWRIRRAGSPGIDGILGRGAGRAQLRAAGFDLMPRAFALLVLHPTTPDEASEAERASRALVGILEAKIPRIVIVYPNNDPGANGIIWCWKAAANHIPNRVIVRQNASREVFLGLMRDAAVLVGNSSSGIIEAASFGTPVVDIGPRQLGRERSGNVVNVPYAMTAIHRAVKRIWNNGRPRRFTGRNVYAGGASNVIPEVLATLQIDNRLLRKLIAY